MKNEIISHLPSDHPWQNTIIWFDTINSTNTQAKALAASGAPHGTVLIADRQTGGRGRMGRSFHSPSGVGIYMSVILRPDCVPSELMHLTCAAAVAMCDAVEEAAQLRPGIKWINDLVIGKKKLAGILTELALDAQTGKVQSAIVGIGINCGHGAKDFPPELQNTATSLKLETGADIDRAALAASMILHLHNMAEGLLNKKRSIMDVYRANCVTIGQDVSVHRFEEVRYGKALDIDNEGALRIQFSDGHIEAVNSGEVSVRGMYGYV